MSSEVAELERTVEVPQGWTVQPLSNLCVEVTDRVDPTAMNAELCRHYIGLEHIGQRTGQFDAIGKADDVVSQKSRFHAGDILYGKLRPNLRKVARPDFDGVCSTDIIVLRAKPTADPAFLFQVLQSEPLVAHAVATAAGTKMPRTHARSILSFDIASPPLDEQRRIAEVLRSVDEAIAANLAALNQARCFQSSIAEHFLRQHSADAEVNLRDVVAETGSGWSPSCDAEAALPDEWGILKTSAITWDGYDDDECKKLPDNLQPKPDLAVRAHDILITRAGQAYRTGVVSFVYATSGTRMISDKIIRIRADGRKILPVVLCQILKGSSVQGQLNPLKSGLTTLTNITQKMIGDVTFPLPPMTDQRRFMQAVESLDGQIGYFVREANSLSRLKAALVADLLSGIVRVPE
jgi:type I restriction enzyme S subunit